jgi:hypothetical protein
MEIGKHFTSNNIEENKTTAIPISFALVSLTECPPFMVREINAQLEKCGFVS